ncbi:hypothetical protein PAP_07475 [Palaeococcus pacificus DY20341]|uniref:Secondary thiamine-phosphate synthase enzyme n=1 Tax=Palaeococcus pacificus DY20341 TaxID=1343739 RepID=A0A075LSZ7_9EURY|nr:secondary thiamine-phosphate synthase enzyme YjbQ [Palaeococcus pacificus]AIF69885.1 hypothetical protein PAP_07475 [Palaeococcus pacificus DY20341]
MLHTIEILTSKEVEIVDITAQVEEIVKKSGISEGLVVVFTRHTTTALILNENEPRLLKDMERIFKELVPKGEGYAHDAIDHNAHSHLRSILMSSSIAIPIENSRLALGTWQSILFIELDGPRRRKVVVKVCQC